MKVNHTSARYSELSQRALAALVELSGFDRGLLYDVPRAGAPYRVSRTGVFVDGSTDWWNFVRRRRQFDDGVCTPIVSLRALDQDERRLVVDWGCRYANTFLLIEPRDSNVDLTEAVGEHRQLLERLASVEPDEGKTEGSRSELVDLLAGWFGRWMVWPAGTADARPVEFSLTAEHRTIRAALLRMMRTRFPGEAFERALLGLLDREPELFSGHPVLDARLPFLTRLGLPVVHEDGQVQRALRSLVNDGQAWLFAPDRDGGFYHGPNHPLPENLPDNELNRLRM